MIQVQSFVFGPLEENTYILYDKGGDCILIDPGSYDEKEKEVLAGFIQKKGLKPVRLLNTHTHLDHILGNAFVFQRYGLKPEYHAFEEPIIRFAPAFADNFGLKYEISPLADFYLKEGDKIELGDSTLKILFTPGHSPGSVSFYSEDSKLLISGDVLFKGSIGRTDLPYGNHEELLKSIRIELSILPRDTLVFSGHGEPTHIGMELDTNPFLQ